MSILIKLRESSNLPNSENEVRKYILKNKEKVISMSVQELASATYTSPATIIRLCKNLDLDGYSDLKLSIARELKSFESMNIDVLDNTAFKKSDTIHDIANKLTDITLKSIEETRILLDEKTLFNVSKKIINSTTIDLYGTGASNNIAFDACFKFMRIGMNCCCLSLIDRQRIQAINSDSSHFAIIISYSGETKEIVEIAKILEENNVPTLSITSSKKNSLMNYTNYNLFVSSKESNIRNGAIASRTSTLYMLDLIYVTCINLQYDKSVDQLNKTLTLLDYDH